MKVFAASIIVLAVACSSEPSDPPCVVAGTYLETVTKESGDCDVPTDPITVTVSTKGNEAFLQFPGITGGCAIREVEQCKYQGKCDFTVTDATVPGATGSAQYSWVFSRTGFTGISTLSIPPAKSLPNGCTGTARAQATRQ